MYYTGFADEAGGSIEVQIKATKELGWDKIESRNIDGVNIHSISDEKFCVVRDKLGEAGVSINCFGSEIANWKRDPRKDEDFRESMEMLKRAVPRMQTLGTKLLRGMSFAVVKDALPDSPEIEKNVFKKVKELVKLCEDNDIIYCHENCMNYGGMSHEHTLRLLEAINSKSFKLVFDTGNPPFTYRRIGNPPYKKQSSWEFYSAVKDHIHYVHIKDSKYIEETDGIFPKAEFTWPGEGDGDVKKIVRDLLENGYKGGFSIEPHMALVYHEGDDINKDKVRYDNYVQYGRKFMHLIESVKQAV